MHACRTAYARDAARDFKRGGGTRNGGQRECGRLHAAARWKGGPAPAEIMRLSANAIHGANHWNSLMQLYGGEHATRRCDVLRYGVCAAPGAPHSKELRTPVGFLNSS